MKRFFVLCTCLGLIAPITLGCQEKKKAGTETSTKTTSPSGATTESTTSAETTTKDPK